MINIQNVDGSECFKCSLVTYLNTADRNPARITKAGKDFPKKLDFKGINLSSKLEIYTKSKRIIPSALVFLVIKIRKDIQFMYQKNVVKQNILICY